eukprot:31430-Pelagococcus_subviridis.AAC.4
MTSSSTLSGRSVINARGRGGARPGNVFKSTVEAIIATSIVASIIANPVPMHTLGPAPNGRYTPPGPVPLSAPFAIGGASVIGRSSVALSLSLSLSLSLFFGAPPGRSHRSGSNASGSSHRRASL